MLLMITLPTSLDTWNVLRSFFCHFAYRTFSSPSRLLWFPPSSRSSTSPAMESSPYHIGSLSDLRTCRTLHGSILLSTWTSLSLLYVYSSMMKIVPPFMGSKNRVFSMTQICAFSSCYLFSLFLPFLHQLRLLEAVCEYLLITFSAFNKTVFTFASQRELTTCSSQWVCWTSWCSAKTALTGPSSQNSSSLATFHRRLFPVHRAPFYKSLSQYQNNREDQTYSLSSNGVFS